ncbi:hypothetical protein PHLGIDRAFT_94318 [Phlebiopsis gigantea 11061_1 CR5-6]|uniref:Thioredoxin domain-containing protein n=1 Tax=Phlebiopsis gigantea (strain 11061_1 CR5-6) TaxID=745531 RepID=A0A0C3S2G9_PHLG1|nr:hypothetical protein PHLGIDRAFT_94318 [Phlebiopsis gigantea 11061_1 CR5-6]
MLLPQLLVLTLAVGPALVQAALFPKDSLVKQLDAKGFKKAMKENQTSLVAFVAPWCGHCQRLAPELSKAALGLYPLIPTYAVDCDKDKNKRLCAEQGVKGFPTLKVFPRGGQSKPLDFTGDERTATALYYWASRAVPHGVTKLYQFDQIAPWVEANKGEHRALLLNQGKHIPLLWQTLGNKYKGRITFGLHRDRQGKTSEKYGMEKGEWGTSKVLIYPAGSSDYVRFEGIQKFDSLSKFFDSVVDGTADLRTANEEARQEELVLDETELEIERKQEAQRIALAHGGFGSLIDFEQAVLTHGKDYHGKQGYPGMMGGGAPAVPVAKKEAKEEKAAATGAQSVAAAASGQAQTAAPGTASAPGSGETFVAHAGEAPGDGARAKDEL